LCRKGLDLFCKQMLSSCYNTFTSHNQELLLYIYEDCANETCLPISMCDMMGVLCRGYPSAGESVGCLSQCQWGVFLTSPTLLLHPENPWLVSFEQLSYIFNIDFVIWFLESRTFILVSLAMSPWPICIICHLNVWQWFFLIHFIWAVTILPNLSVICVEITKGAASCVKCWHVSYYIELHFQESSSVLRHLVFSGCVLFRLVPAALEYNFSVHGSEVFSCARAVM
jgi:hypothetical protein